MRSSTLGNWGGKLSIPVLGGVLTSNGGPVVRYNKSNLFPENIIFIESSIIDSMSVRRGPCGTLLSKLAVVSLLYK